MHLAERFGQAPYGPWQAMSAAQVSVILAALQEAEVPDGVKRKDQPLRKTQPRVNRNVLLAMAREQDPTVWDVKADG